MQKIIFKVTCDLPHPKEVVATKTIRFRLDGSAFEMDACAEDARKISAAMAPFIDAARLQVNGKPKQHGRTRSQRKHAQAVREWAVAHDVPVATRGRIPARVEAAYIAGQADEPADCAVAV